MLAKYFSVNFITVMILLAIIAMMYVNRDVKIPATSLFALSMIFMILLTVASAIDAKDPYTHGHPYRMIFSVLYPQ